MTDKDLEQLTIKPEDLRVLQKLPDESITVIKSLANTSLQGAKVHLLGGPEGLTSHYLSKYDAYRDILVATGQDVSELDNFRSSISQQLRSLK